MSFQLIASSFDMYMHVCSSEEKAQHLRFSNGGVPNSRSENSFLQCSFFLEVLAISFLTFAAIRLANLLQIKRRCDLNGVSHHATSALPLFSCINQFPLCSELYVLLPQKYNGLRRHESSVIALHRRSPSQKKALLMRCRITK